MTLSNSYSVNVGSWNRLRLTWSASQDHSANTSTITARLYWETIGGNGYVNSHTSKTGNIVIDGVSSSFTATAYLKAGGSKLLHTYVRTISHNSNGDKKLNISGTFNMSVTLSGTPYSSRTVSGSDDLKSIPRESTMASSPDLTAGSNRTISIQRGSTSFRHEIDIAIQRRDGVYDFIKTVDSPKSEMYVLTSFSTSNHEEIFRHLDGRTTANIRMILKTYSGSSHIGSNTYVGTVTAPGRSYPDTSFEQSVVIGQTIDVNLVRSHNSFTHRVTFKLGGLSKSFSNVGTFVSWTPTETERNLLIAAIPSNSSSADGVIEVETFYGSEQVKTTYTKSMTFNLPTTGTNPTFTSSQVSYDDTNSITTAVTGNNEYIIQDRSILRVRIISAASAKNGASIKHYVITVNGISKTVTSTGYTTIGTISATSNVILSVRAVDTRGLSTTVTKVVNVLPYVPPSISVSANRLNGFDDTVNLSMEGYLSTLKIGTTNKNAVVSAKYQYREKGVGSFNALTNFSYSPTLPSFTTSTVALNLPNKKAWEVKIQLADKLSTSEFITVVEVGQPLLFFDPVKRSIGFNDFPVGYNEWRLNGRLVMGANMWNDNAPEEDSAGAIDMNNSDIVGCNAFYFNDVAQSTEGLFFLKSSANEGSTDPAHYDNFKIYNGEMYFDAEIKNQNRIMSTLKNGWEHYSSSLTGVFAPATYWRDKNGVVHITGLIKNGATGEGVVLFTLPSGYRPSQTHIYTCMTSTAGAVRVDVRASGDVVLQDNASFNWLSVSPISFKGEG